MISWQRRLLLATGVLIAAGECLAETEVDETKRVDPDGVVQIHCTRGELTVIGWDRDEVHVEGELDDLADGLRFEVTQGRTIIRVEMPNERINWGDASELEISIPARSKLRIEGVSTDIELSDIQGDIAIRTVSGDVTARTIGDAVRIHTVSGDVVVSEGGGRVKVVTVSGDADIDADATDITIDTVSGEIDLDLADFDRLIANATNGELEVDGRLKPAGQIDASTVNGDIAIRLDDPVHASIEASTGPGGDIDNDLTDDEPTSNRPGSKALRTSAGDGSAGIRLHTVNGDIHLDES